MDNASKRMSTGGFRNSQNSTPMNSNANAVPNSNAMGGGGGTGGGTGGRPTTVTGAGAEMDTALVRAVGRRIKITTSQSKTFEGTLYTVAAGLVAVNTGVSTPSTNALGGASTSSGAGNTFHFISTSQVSSLTSFPDNVSAEALVPYKLDKEGLQKREDKAIEKIMDQERKIGKGVTKEAQELFNFFDRMYPVHWANKVIIVNDNVRIDPPYALENCRASKENKQAETQIRKVLEGYYNKKAGAASSSNAGSSAVNSGSSTPSGTRSGQGAGQGGSGNVRPAVVPAVPRKGG